MNDENNKSQETQNAQDTQDTSTYQAIKRLAIPESLRPIRDIPELLVENRRICMEMAQQVMRQMAIMADTPKIYEALSQVQNELRAPKDAYNAFGKYNYRTAKGILCMAKPICERNGVVLTLSDRPIIVGD